jgi:hypothetical protein
MTALSSSLITFQMLNIYKSLPEKAYCRDVVQLGDYFGCQGTEIQIFVPLMI